MDTRQYGRFCSESAERAHAYEKLCQGDGEPLGREGEGWERLNRLENKNYQWAVFIPSYEELTCSLFFVLSKLCLRIGTASSPCLE